MGCLFPVLLDGEAIYRLSLILYNRFLHSLDNNFYRKNNSFYKADNSLL